MRKLQVVVDDLTRQTAILSQATIPVKDPHLPSPKFHDTSTVASTDRPHQSHVGPVDNSGLETAATSIEQLVLGSGLRLGITEEPSLLPSVELTYNPISELLSMQSEHGSSRDQVIVDAILRLLPPSATTSRILIEDYFKGPIHRGWHVSVILSASSSDGVYRR